MKKRVGLIGQVGYVMVIIGILTMFANSPERSLAAAVWILAGIVVAILGGLAGTMSRIEIASLVIVCVAVLIYFFTDNKTLTYLFMNLAVILVVIDLIIRFKNKISPEEQGGL